MSHEVSRRGLVAEASRRRFVKGLAAGGALLGLGVPPLAAAAISSGRRSGAGVLSGSRFDLTCGEVVVNLTGRIRHATAVNGSVPAPVLRWRQGDTVTVNVSNRLAVDTSIHWHGIILPASQDGVPHVSEDFRGIGPGETFRYRFTVRQSGTYWYHSHSGFQEQTGLYGAIVIEPREPEPFHYDRDHVVLLSDWSDETPEAIYAKLKKLSHYYSTRERTLADTVADLRQRGLAGLRAERAMWNRMRMSDRDLSDVTGATYTFLMNGATPAHGWQGLFRAGERVRLRFINAAAMTFFDVRIPGLAMTVVAADGQNVEPVTVDEFRIGVAETCDVLVEPAADRPWTIFAQAIDRSGYARGTLSPDPSWIGEVPELDPVPVLGHADMGMGDSSDGGHAGHGTDASAPPDGGHGGHGMDHTAMAGGSQAVGGGQGHEGHAGQGAAMPGPGRAGHGSARILGPGSLRTGPGVDTVAERPLYRLDDPGVGLRGNGRRVLTYADLRKLAATDDPREPEREIDIHLTGNMSRYMWSFDGIPSRDAEPLALRLGERLRINLVNDTMMHHPVHLHGMWSDLETGDGGRIPRKHTVVAQPGAVVSYLVTADAPGAWAYHCHLLYHMPGMFRTVVVR
jgi:CopA family copper-resistance protein